MITKENFEALGQIKKCDKLSHLDFQLPEQGNEAKDDSKTGDFSMQWSDFCWMKPLVNRRKTENFTEKQRKKLKN
ncbi:hypothetical protein FBR06_02065 [Betaproteobacteria bacterium PRO4]|nr:hypothetical protein [Betaproteobacteria bacterium PRO4]